jgi:integration host factor subunit alpha
MSGKTVTPADLYRMAYKKFGLTLTQSATLIELVLKEIMHCLERGETVKLSSFGLFVVRKRSQRLARNPKTGEQVPIPPRRVVVFKPSLKQRINACGPVDGITQADASFCSPFLPGPANLND